MVAASVSQRAWGCEWKSGPHVDSRLTPPGPSVRRQMMEVRAEATEPPAAAEGGR